MLRQVILEECSFVWGVFLNRLWSWGMIEASSRFKDYTINCYLVLVNICVSSLFNERLYSCRPPHRVLLGATLSRSRPYTISSVQFKAMTKCDKTWNVGSVMLCFLNQLLAGLWQVKCVRSSLFVRHKKYGWLRVQPLPYRWPIRSLLASN